MDLAILQNNTSVRENCVICSREHKPEIPFAVFKDSELGKPVCSKCTRHHAPQLYSLLNFFYQQPHDTQKVFHWEYQDPNEKITAWLEELRKMAYSLELGDLEKFCCDLSKLRSYSTMIFNFAQGLDDNRKETEARKAIESLMKEGVSFRTIKLNDMDFYVRNGRIERIEEDDIPF